MAFTDHPQPDRTGFFRVQPTIASVRESKIKKSIGVEVVFRILEWWDESNKAWVDWREYEPYEVTGCYWVISGKGEPNRVAIEFLGRGLGWRGDLREFSQADIQWPACVCSVKQREFEKRDGSKGSAKEANMLQRYDWAPQAFAVEASTIDNAMNMHGSAIRALIGNIEAPPAPPAAGESAPATPAPPVAPQDLPKDAVPF